MLKTFQRTGRNEHFESNKIINPWINKRNSFYQTQNIEKPCKSYKEIQNKM